MMTLEETITELKVRSKNQPFLNVGKDMGIALDTPQTRVGLAVKALVDAGSHKVWYLTMNRNDPTSVRKVLVPAGISFAETYHNRILIGIE